MAEKAEDNAHALALAETSEPESEEGGGGDGGGGWDGESAGPSSPIKKSQKSPKKKKVTSAGMQLPEYWPWQEAKKLFEHPDVVKGDDLEVGRVGSGRQRWDADRCLEECTCC
jgi:flap endonuclease-1